VHFAIGGTISLAVAMDFKWYNLKDNDLEFRMTPAMGAGL